MQNEMLAVDEARKVELGAVKTGNETGEAEGELFGIEQTKGPPSTVKYEHTYETFLKRSKEGHIVQDWRNELERQDIQVKLEEDGNCKEFKIKVEEVIMEHENDDLNDANGEIAVNRIKKEQIVTDWKNGHKMQDTEFKLEEDKNCEEFKIEFEEMIIKDENDDLEDADREIAVNRSLEITNNQNQSLKTEDKMTCTQCNIAFKRKSTRDDHIVRMHPHLIASVSSKIHECTHCTYKTIMKDRFTKHTSQHYKTADSYKLRSLEITTRQNHHLKTEAKWKCKHCNTGFKRKVTMDDHIVRMHSDSIASVKTADKLTCVQCDAVFTRKITRDEHIVSKHPNSVASVSNKIHQCTYCTYQTVIKAQFARHMLKHPETADSYKLSTCFHCNATFNSKRTLDGHILRKHPGSAGSISTKMYYCTHCTFKTVIKSQFARHMLKHPETADSHSYKLSTCIHCNAKYNYKIYLDDHILRHHPEYIASVSSKIHECTQCSYKTVVKANLNYHMSKHPETANNYKFRTCIHCNAKYKNKTNLDEHILRQHPKYIASVSSKIHECIRCAFKTAIPAHLARHMLKHPETADTYKFSTGVHFSE